MIPVASINGFASSSFIACSDTSKRIICLYFYFLSRLTISLSFLILPYTCYYTFKYQSKKKPLSPFHPTWLHHLYIYIYESWLNLILNLSILLSSLLGNNLVDAHELRYRFCQRKAQAVVRTVNEHMRKKLYSPTTPFFENEILYILLCILCANIQISIYNWAKY